MQQCSVHCWCCQLLESTLLEYTLAHFVHADTAVCCHAMWNLVLVTSCKIISCNDRNHLTSSLPSFGPSSAKKVTLPFRVFLRECSHVIMLFLDQGAHGRNRACEATSKRVGFDAARQLLFTARLRERRGTSQGRPVPCSFVG